MSSAHLAYGGNVFKTVCAQERARAQRKGIVELRAGTITKNPPYVDIDTDIEIDIDIDIDIDIAVRLSCAVVCGVSPRPIPPHLAGPSALFMSFCCVSC